MSEFEVEKFQLQNSNHSACYRRYELYALMLFPFLFFFLSLQAQGDFRSQIYKAYITGDMDRWERLLKNTPEPAQSTSALYEYALAHYGLIGYCLGIEEKVRAESYLGRTEELAEKLLDMNPDEPKFIALRGALYGFQMGFNKPLIPIIGPKSLKTINRSLKIDSNSPQALIESGNKDWWMPAVFGGSKEQALREYERAIAIFDRDPAFQQENWYYLNIHMILAGWYNEIGLNSRARGIYQKLLRIEPDFEWAKQLMN